MLRQLLFAFTQFLIFYITLLQASAQHKVVETWYDLKRTVPKEQYYVLSKSPSILDSAYHSFHLNGKSKIKGNYSRNKASGAWEYFFENGNLKMKGVLKDNISEGKWQYFYENGKINMEGEMYKGVRDGEWKYYYENEGLKSHGLYKKDKKEGLWKYFYEDGQFKAQCVYDNDKGAYYEFYPSGEPKSEGEIVAGKSSGIWKYYYENGTIKAEGEEKDGIKEGMWKFYHPNGKLLSEGIYTKGSSEGHWKYYYDNGTLNSEGTQKENKKDGYWKLYYKNGAFKAEGNFSKGDGSYKEYYESGKLRMEGTIQNEKNQGLWKYYYENGLLEGTCFFTNGQGKYTGFYESGKISMEGVLIDGKKSGVWKLYKEEDGSIAGYYKTYYENDVEVFKELPIAADSLNADSVTPYAKPKIRIPKKKSRYFASKINEFRSFILSTNPFAMLFFQLPVSLEYYFQERLGFEAGCTWYREPFFIPNNKINVNEIYRRGFRAYLRQKFYQKDQEIGMFYFGHEIRFTNIQHTEHYFDTLRIPNPRYSNPKVNTFGFEYSILVGDRIMQDAKRSGWTIDIYAGLGVGYLIHQRSWLEPVPAYEKDFGKILGKNISTPVKFGISFGYVFNKKNFNSKRDYKAQ